MEGHDTIAEIRGIADNQNMEEEMLPILDQKLEEFPDRDKYRIGLLTYKYIVDLLPIIASILFIFTLNIKEEKYIRLLLLGNLISWVVYDYYVLAYLAEISDLFVIISTLIAIYRYDIKS